MPLKPDLNGYAPIGLSREQAAHYVGVSPVSFDTMVEAGEMPRPKRWRGRRIWDRIAIEMAFHNLPEGLTPVQRVLEQARKSV